MLRGREVTVLGAGIAGLAVATALAQRGAAVRVLEQTRSIREVGAGLQVSPNGMAVLAALGVDVSAGQVAGAVVLMDGETAAPVTRINLLAQAPAGQFRFFHRADLIAALETAARRSGVDIALGHKVSEVRLGGTGPQLVSGAGNQAAPILIGADGLHSQVRAALNGGQAPMFTGQVAWRATLRAEPGMAPEARVSIGPGRHLVSYPLRGGHLRNIVAVEERRSWVAESWSLTDDPQALRSAFETFVPEVRGWLERIDRPGLWGLFRHPVAARWHGQGAAILGDAAHPTLPFLAQGANMALEDAWVLAAAMARAEPEAAFAAYQTSREARVRRIVAAANANARNYHLSGLKRDAVHFGLRLATRLAPHLLADRYRWLYDHDVTRG